MLVPLVVVVAGCLPQPPPDLPADLLSKFGGAPGQTTFTAATPPAGTSGQAIVIALRAQSADSMFRSRALPIFGVVDCHGAPGCAPGPGGAEGGPARTIWVVLYPACTDAAGSIAGWVVVDAINGVKGGYYVANSCDP